MYVNVICPYYKRLKSDSVSVTRHDSPEQMICKNSRKHLTNTRLIWNVEVIC